MVKRMVIMLLSMAAFVGILGFVKFRKIQASTEQSSSFQPPPEAVTTIIARQEDWQGTLNAIGTVAAVNGVTVSADLPGVVQKIAFGSGDRVETGDVLVQLDTRQEQAQLVAAEARLELARLSFERAHGLRGEGISSQADFDTAQAEQKQAEGIVGEIRATIERKTIRAPFSGLLGLRQVNLGQYLKSGDPVVPLQSLDPIYVNFDVPQQELGRMRVGGEVRVTAEGMPGVQFAGRITAIDSIVDDSTRNVRGQATLEHTRGRLRPGMFVKARMVLDSSEKVVAIPASAISYAPYGDSVFIVEEITGPNGKTYRGVRQHFVKLGGARGDQVAVLSGITPGAEIVTSGAFKLRNEAAVEVNNAVQPANETAPKPEDN
ncbi:MAG TPA: efflux RND transporter periplasmic adaptor subunit [Candidatus Polarisedimenticolia bacterium]|nr:efflux RND transporter periplasmic adaptor subunit [Candidatus Polarisedimenticolia bacterium]